MAASHEWDTSSLANAGRAIAAATSDYHELAEVTFLEIARLIPTDFFQLGIFDEAQYRTLILIQDGTRSENHAYSMDREGENLIGWVRRTGQALLVHDFISERNELPALPGYEAKDPPVSGLFIPLGTSNVVIGILAIQSRVANALSDDHVQLLTVLAHSISLALAQIKFRQETEHLTFSMVLIQEISHALMSLDPLSDRLQQVITLIAELLDFKEVMIFESIEGQIELRNTTSAEARSEIPQLVQRSAQENVICVTTRKSDAADLREEIEYAIPLAVVDRLLGVLFLQARGEIDLEGDKGSMLEMLANQLGFAMLEARNYDARQEEAWMTTVLLEIARHAAQPGDTLAALQAVLQLATLLAGTDWALLLLPDEIGESLSIGVHAGFRRKQSLGFEAVVLSSTEFDLDIPLVESQNPRRIDLPDPLDQMLEQTQALCLNLTDGNTLLGLLLMQDSPLPGIRPALLAGIGHQVSLRLENARLVEEAAVRRSLERELTMARNIQSSFIPEIMPSVPGWEIASAWKVAREVGGDFYDIIPLPTASHGIRWGIVIADVADKGIPAALYMALCRTLLRSVAQTHIQPARTLEIVNQQLISDTRADLFVSAFYGIWEPDSGTLTFANAGHPPPFLFRPGRRAQIIRDHGMVLGVMPQVEYTDHLIQFSPGDLLLLYTDGVNEAQNSDHDLFGVERLESLILSQKDWNATSIASAIVDRVVNFSGGRDFSDDLTAVTMRRVT